MTAAPTPASIADLVRRLHYSAHFSSTSIALYSEAASALEALARELSKALEAYAEMKATWQAEQDQRQAAEAERNGLRARVAELENTRASDFKAEYVERLIRDLTAERDALRARLSELSPTPSVPNPCSICGVPIYGSFIGTGDGSLQAGGSFAHPECYYRARISALEASNRRLALDLNAAEARASGAEARVRLLDSPTMDRSPDLKAQA